MKKLSRKSVVKAKKQQLCDRINRCKSLEELKGWERTFSYYDVLHNDQDWDYDFFLSLIEFKLRKMREYFWSHNIVENEKQYGDICNKLINLLKAGYQTDIVLTKDLYNKVNSKNAKRFIIKAYWKHLDKNDEYWQKYGLAIIRESKAKALFWKYLYHKIELLWD